MRRTRALWDAVDEVENWAPTIGPVHAIEWVEEAAQLALGFGITDLAVQLIAEGMPWPDALAAAKACGCPFPSAEVAP